MPGLITIYRRAVPFRLVLAGALFFMINSMRKSAKKSFSVHRMTKSAHTPDVSVYGYSPEQAMTWYQNIGYEGREAYVILSVIDFVFIIPIYVLLLSAQMLKSRVPPWMVYIPTVTACFDLLENAVHSYSCWKYPEIPSVAILRLASVATLAKFVGVGVSVLSALVFGVLRKLDELAEEEEREEQERTKQAEEEKTATKKSRKKKKA